MTKDIKDVLNLALDALEEIALAGMSGTGQESEEAMTEWHARQAWSFMGIAARALEPIKEALKEHAMREVQRLGQEIEQEPVADAYTFAEMRFVVCPNCGNKRCPKANDHRNACTNSNEVGQKGSSWEHVKPLAQPEHDYRTRYDRGCYKCGSHYCPADCPEPLHLVPQQPEQEPVACEHKRTSIWTEDQTGHCNDCGASGRMRFIADTTPPQRTWVGLTDEEKSELWEISRAALPRYATYASLAEAKLKERNT